MTPNFEEILLELSYRVPTGIVDLTNEQHLDELVTILEEKGIYNSKAINALKEKAKTNDKDPDVTYVDKKGQKRTVKYSSAIKYDEKHPAYLAAMKLMNKKSKSPKDTPKSVKPATIKVTGAEKRAQQKVEPKSSAPTPTTKTKGGTNFKDALFSTSKQKGDDKKEAFIQKKKEGAIKVIQNLTDSAGNINLLTEPGGKPVKIKSKAIQQIVGKIFDGSPISAEEAKLFNSVGKIVTNPENGTVKLYFAKKFVGRHPQQGYDSIEIATDNVAMTDAVRKFALSNKLNVGKSSEGAIGKKVLTPTKMASAVNPKQPERIAEIKEIKNGITIDGKPMTKKQIPNEKNLIASLTPSLGAKEAAVQANLIVRQTEAYNQRLDDLLAVAKSSNGKVPVTNFGDVTTPQSRKKTANNIIDGTIKRFESELNKYGETFGKTDLLSKPENKAVFDSLNKLKQMNSKFDLEANSKHREEYKKELDNLLIAMSNSPDFVDSVADYAEMKAGLQFLAEGKQVYFPASENFQTADIIVMPDDFSIKPKKGQSLEQAIAENLQFYSVGVTYVGGLSVKYKGGGGSANYSKISQTEYKNKDTQKKLLGVQSIYGLVYPKNKSEQLNIPNSSIAEAKNKLKDLVDWAVKSGIMTKEEARQLDVVGTKKGNAILDKALKDVARCKGANRKNFEEAVRLHHIMQQMTAFNNNKDVKYTRFSNFNQEIYQNKDGLSVRVEDDIADGVSKPCYMNPHHNPGFSTVVDDKTGCVTGTPTNQNPSHIESSPPKNLLKA